MTVLCLGPTVEGKAGEREGGEGGKKGGRGRGREGEGGRKGGRGKGRVRESEKGNDGDKERA